MIISRNGSLTTGTTLNPNNVWAGSAFEFLPWPAYISIGVITPGTAGGLLATQYLGGNLVAEEFLVPFRAPTVDGPSQPQIPGDMTITMGGSPNQRIVTTLRNPTGGTVSYNGLAIVTPAGGGGGGGRRRRR